MPPTPADRLVARRELFASILVLAATPMACGGAAARTAKVPASPDAAQASRCHVKASEERPLVTDWPATERSRFERRAAQGLIVVRYAGCEMRVLERCQAVGSYAFAPTTVATDGFSVTDEDELYARLPLGAVSLEGELKKTGRLTLAYVVVGQYDADQADPKAVRLDGECAGATHIVTGFAVGAFRLASGKSAAAGGGAGVMGVAGGSKQTSSEEVIRSGGDTTMCLKTDSASQGGHGAAPAGCSTPIQLYLTPLPGGAGGSNPAASAEPAHDGKDGVDREAIDPSGEEGPSPALPSTRFLMYASGGGVGGGDLKLANPFDNSTKDPFSVGIGPQAAGWIGLRYAIENNIDLQSRVGLGFTWMTGKYDPQLVEASMLLITPSGDLTVRYRPKAGAFYAGVGLGGHLLFVTGSATSSATQPLTVSATGKQQMSSAALWGDGLAEVGLLFGDRSAWDLGLRGGGGTTITFDNPLVFWGTLALGRTLD